VIKSDPFTAKLMELYLVAQKEKSVQPMSLGIQRSDYMLDQGGDCGGDGYWIMVVLQSVGRYH